MKLTDELREWMGVVLTDDDPAHAIADRIDAEVADKQAFCDRLYEAAKNREEVTLWGVDYIALPVDADGVPVLEDDKIEICGKPYRVWNLCLDSDKKWFLNCDEGDWDGDEIATLRNYHPPTVEDVLEQFVARWMDTHHDDLPALKAEYAAKLQLREDA